jgi:hypothetical protein
VDALGDTRPRQPGRLGRILRWRTHNGGTLLLIAALILTQQVWARSLTSPAALGPSATGVNYQGRLADSGGAPLDGTYNGSRALFTTACTIQGTASTKGAILWPPLCTLPSMIGGGRGIRTPGDLSATTVFKTVAIVHSAIPPVVKILSRPRREVNSQARNRPPWGKETRIVTIVTFVKSIIALKPNQDHIVQPGPHKLGRRQAASGG